MDPAIQPCVPCAQLHGEPSTAEPHDDLSMTGATGSNDTKREEHYRCARCGGVFVRILEGKPARCVWALVNAGQH
jgi:hypothetical protein